MTSTEPTPLPATHDQRAAGTADPDALMQTPVKTAIIRLVYPFNLPESLASSNLTSESVGANWTLRKQLPQRYTDNLLPLVNHWLFGQGSNEAQYFIHTRPEAALCDGIFRHIEEATEVRLGTPPWTLTQRPGETPDSAIELFLAAKSAGVLSIAIQISAGPSGVLTLGQVARAVNLLHHGHPQDQDRDDQPPPPASLHEVALNLTADLRRGKPPEALEVRRSFLAYTALELAENSNLGPGPHGAGLRAALLAIQCARPLEFAGLIEGHTLARVSSLSTHHLCAVGEDGAAHMVGNPRQYHQIDPSIIGGHFFEDATTKYFFPYLLTLIQRLVVGQLAERAFKLAVHDETTRPSPHTSDMAPGAVSDLNRNLLENAIKWQRTHVQTSQAAQYFYHLCREALEIEASFDLLQKALTAIENREMQRRMDESLKAIQEVQEKVDWAEVLLVAYYGLAATHYIGEAIGLSHEKPHWYGLGFSGVALLFLVIALLAFRPWRTHDPKKQWWRNPMALLALPILLMAIFLVIARIF